MDQQSETRLEWAKRMVEEKKTLLHIETNMIGLAIRVYAGPEGDAWISPINKEPVNAIVVELDTGHAFIVPEEEEIVAFVELTDKQANFYQSMQKIFAHTLRDSASMLRALGIEMEFGIKLITGILKTQLFLLEATSETNQEVM